MHPDALSDLRAGERPQRLDAVRQKITLTFHDDVGDAPDGLAALVDVVDEELRASHVLADVLPLVVAHRRRSRTGAARRLELTDELPVDGIHPQREATRLTDFDLE